MKYMLRPQQNNKVGMSCNGINISKIHPVMLTVLHCLS